MGGASGAGRTRAPGLRRAHERAQPAGGAARGRGRDRRRPVGGTHGRAHRRGPAPQHPRRAALSRGVARRPRLRADRQPHGGRRHRGDLPRAGLAMAAAPRHARERNSRRARVTAHRRALPGGARRGARRGPAAAATRQRGCCKTWCSPTNVPNFSRCPRTNCCSCKKAPPDNDDKEPCNVDRHPRSRSADRTSRAPRSHDPGSLRRHHAALWRRGRRAAARLAAHRAHAGAARRRTAVAAAAHPTLRARARRAHRQPGGADGARRPGGDLPLGLAGRCRRQFRGPDLPRPEPLSGGQRADRGAAHQPRAAARRPDRALRGHGRPRLVRADRRRRRGGVRRPAERLSS